LEACGSSEKHKEKAPELASEKAETKAPETTTQRKRNASITPKRVAEHGQTPLCGGCMTSGEAYGYKYHNRKCRKRFNLLYPEETAATETTGKPAPSAPVPAPGMVSTSRDSKSLRSKDRKGEKHSPEKGQSVVQNILEELPEHVPACVMNSVKNAAEYAYKQCLQENTKSERTTLQQPLKALVEFACSEDSTLCQVAGENGLPFLRLHKQFADLMDPKVITQLEDWIVHFGPVHLHGSLPCTPWTSWQYLNSAKGGEAYKRRLNQDRRASMIMFANFAR
jgi:hypothetical protein